MMWLEASLSSLLVALSLVLLLGAPSNSTDPMSDAARYWALSDRAAAAAELAADSGPSPLAGSALDDDSLRAAVFSSPSSFCYRWQWLAPLPRGSKPEPLSPLYISEPDCEAAFLPPNSNLRTIERGVWRGGRLQFLRMEQAPRK